MVFSLILIQICDNNNDPIVYSCAGRLVDTYGLMELLSLLLWNNSNFSSGFQRKIRHDYL